MQGNHIPVLLSLCCLPSCQDLLYLWEVQCKLKQL